MSTNDEISISNKNASALRYESLGDSDISNYNNKIWGLANKFS
jgi:hypothetical protein